MSEGDKDMKQKDAKRQIIQLWARRDRNKLTRLDVLGFYAELEKEHRELLKFKYGGDKYQVIMAWLSDYIVE